EPRRELAEGVAHGGPDDGLVEELGLFRLSHASPPQNSVPAFIRKCSTMGPSAKAGKNVSAPTITITPTSSTTNTGPVTGNVPADSGTFFFAASDPAIPRIGISMKKRPKNMSRPSVVLYQSVLAFSPANAEPLLPAPDV